MIDPKQIEDAFDAFDAAAHPSGAMGPAPLTVSFDACGTWHSIRNAVEAVIKALQAIGTLVPFAKRAASVLQTLKNILDTLCH